MADIAPTRFDDKPAMKLAGFRKSYKFQTMEEIPQLWHAFGPKMGDVPNGIGGEVAYGLSLANGDEAGFDYMAAVEVSTFDGIPEEFTTLEIPAHKYAVFPHEGHVSELCVTIDNAMQKWLPESEYQHDMPPIMFEYYGPGFCPDEGKGDLEIWVPVKA